MNSPIRAAVAALTVTLAFFFVISSTAAMAQDRPNRTKLAGTKRVPADEWSRVHVQRVLQAFANGGQATEAQLDAWAKMKPDKAIREMLNFRPIHLKLSPQGAEDNSRYRCDSLQEMQEFWGSDHKRNPMRAFNRPYHTTLTDEEDPNVSPVNLFFTWNRAMHTPGCNGFVHKLAFYLTNYHASIHIENAASTLMRSYYDDMLSALSERASFVELMTTAASHAALSRAYGHMGNHFNEAREFQGNDDFAREYFQLLFGIQGTTEDPDYHENVTIEHNAWLLTGMALDAEYEAWGSMSPNDWLIAPIRFGNHYDPAGRLILNRTWHYEYHLGNDSCLEILHEQICGANAEEKLRALGPVAAAHPESMASTPLKIVRFFGDDRIDAEEAKNLQRAWVDANYDLLAFLRSYAISTMFHDPSTFKMRNAFDRNLVIHNANQLTMEEAYAEPFFEGPTIRIFEQGALVFAPIRDVFGGQTGADAVNDRYVFKSAWDSNVNNPGFLGKAVDYYQLEPDGEVQEWRKDWSSVIPVNGTGQHRAGEVGLWLWKRFIGDDGANFDPIAKAQVNAMLATGFDFGALMNEEQPDRLWSSEDLLEGDAAEMNRQLGDTILDLSTQDANERVGMAINFITALPYTYAMGGVQ